MLLRFGVENHGSIATYQELQMIATTLKDAEEGLFTVGGNVGPASGELPGKRLRVTTVAGIYGANAAGKSTLLKAFDFFSKGIVFSHTSVASGKGTAYYPFKLDEISRSKPSKYDADIVIDNIRYHYGYQVDGQKVVSEWLYSFDLRAIRQIKSILFFRETDKDFVTNFQFGKSLKGENKQISKLVRANSLYLSTAAQNAHPQLTPIYDFFYKKVVRRLDSELGAEDISEQLSAYFGTDPQRQAMALKFLSAADIGIAGMDFSKIAVDEKEKLIFQEFEQVLNRHLKSDGKLQFFNRKEKAKVSLLHLGAEAKEYPIDLRQESAGTLALLQLIGPIITRLNEGGILIVDELNSTLHPLVSRELVRLFSTPATNPGKAQLLFTTHDTNLLTGQLLRRDQIWFAEKDARGATHIYALSDIKVRADDNFERGYLTGRFGAIPFVGCSLDEVLKSFPMDTENIPRGKEKSSI